MEENRLKEIKEKYICTKPFENIEIDENGNVYSCCPDYTGSYILGNIFKKPFEDIWYGKKFSSLRKNVIDGIYRNCKLEYCYNIETPAFFKKNKKKSIIKEKPSYPKNVTISIDETCNAKCIFCRDKTIVPDKEKMNKFIEMIDDYFIPMLKNAELILLDGSGEVFCSKFGRKFIRTVCDKYPKIRFEILTNGFLCNEKNLKELGLYDRLSLVTVSLHATTKETYEKIVKGIDFDKVIENIKFLSSLKKSGKLNTFYLTFVVTALNYKELPNFVEFAYSVGAIPQAWGVRENLITEYLQKEISKYNLNILNKNHPEHQQFLEVLQNPIFSKYELISDFLFDFNKKMVSFYKK
ncbi:MAG: radical SAM protein [Candidatus Gastranaerophilaceae bacterium]